MTFSNVLSGEVWLASGQSNMQFALNKVIKAETHIKTATFPDIRFLKMNPVSKETPQDRVTASPWFAMTPDTAGEVSGVAYFFARRLHQELGMPIGILQAAWGGSKIQAWIPSEKLDESPDAEKLRASFRDNVDNYKKALKKWETDKKGKKPTISGSGPQHMPTALHNGMINPLQPFAIKGAIWYQGESDSYMRDGYPALFKLLVESWRENFKQSELPVYFAQLPDYDKPHWGHFRLEQASIPSLVPNTDYIVLIGAGEINDIHPRNKLTPGNRFAQLALARDYGKEIVPGGPIPIGATRKGNRIEISFRQVGKGLELKKHKSRKGSQIALFAGKQKVTPSSVAIGGKDTLVLEIPDGTDAVTEVRYGTYANPWPEIFNKDGLPGTPFQMEPTASE